MPKKSEGRWERHERLNRVTERDLCLTTPAVRLPTSDFFCVDPKKVLFSAPKKQKKSVGAGLVSASACTGTR